MQTLSTLITAHETLNTIKSILDKILRVENSALREMCVKNELSIHWTEKQYQISFVLTKKVAPHHQALIKHCKKEKQ